MKKIIFLVLASLFTLVPSLSNARTISVRENNYDLGNQQIENTYTYIPHDILDNYGGTIAEVDEIITKNHLAGGVVSNDKNFNLNVYYKTIKIGILPYLHKSTPLFTDIQNLSTKIESYIINKDKLLEVNKKYFVNGIPEPTTFLPKHPQSQNLILPNLVGSGYNANNAVNYAHLWTENGRNLRNSNYDYFAGMNDCTNFVSQVLEAGGISYVHNDNWGWDYDDPDNWYYENSFLNIPSYTWGGAHNLYLHLANHSSDVRRVFSTSDLQVGDIVQWDTEPDDGIFHIGHSTVVTRIQNGRVYLTYHSTDREDEPASTLYNAGYLAYAWAVNH